MKWIFPTLVLLFIVGLTDWALAKKETKSEKKIRIELNKVCEVYKKANQMADSKEFLDRQRLVDEKLEQDLNAKIKMDSVRKIWKNLKIADPINKYEFWTQAADDLGVKEWSCPDIETFYQRAN